MLVISYYIIIKMVFSQLIKFVVIIIIHFIIIKRLKKLTNYRFPYLFLISDNFGTWHRKRCIIL